MIGADRAVGNSPVVHVDWAHSPVAESNGSTALSIQRVVGPKRSMVVAGHTAAVDRVAADRAAVDRAAAVEEPAVVRIGNAAVAVVESTADVDRFAFDNRVHPPASMGRGREKSMRDNRSVSARRIDSGPYGVSTQPARSSASRQVAQ